MKTLLFLALAAAAHAAPYVVTLEPDGFADGVELTLIVPEFSLQVAGTNNLPLGGVNKVTAESEGIYEPPTGTNVFGRNGIPFWNNNTRLRIDFTVPVEAISLIFASGGSSEIGRLDAFDSSGTLIGSYVTAALANEAFETMVINRPQTDIAFAVAYSAPGEGNFGRLDLLQVTVPEPSTAAMLGLGLLALTRRPRRDTTHS